MDEERVDSVMLALFIQFTALCLSVLGLGSYPFQGVGPLWDCDGRHESSSHTHTQTLARIFGASAATVGLIRGPRLRARQEQDLTMTLPFPSFPANSRI